MGRMYRLDFDVAIAAADDDILEVLLPADLCVVIHELRITQNNIEGDANADQIEIECRRHITHTSGTGGASATPVKMQTGDAASSCTCEVGNVTTPASGTTEEVLLRESFNVAVGLFWTPTPECRPVLSPSQAFVVNVVNAPDASTTFTGSLFFEEIGG